MESKDIIKKWEDRTRLVIAIITIITFVICSVMTMYFTLQLDWFRILICLVATIFWGSMLNMVYRYYKDK
jgi:hypothetical protein